MSSFKHGPFFNGVPAYLSPFLGTSRINQTSVHTLCRFYYSVVKRFKFRNEFPHFLIITKLTKTKHILKYRKTYVPKFKCNNNKHKFKLFFFE